jgi:broad specificity phosphatase PhoE
MESPEMSARVVYLARHGQSTWNADGRIAGQLDPPLSPRGVAQATSLALLLGRVALGAVHSSPLTRALETARPTATVHGLDVQQDEALKELDFGRLQGRYRDARDVDAQRALQDWYDGEWTAPPADGESRLDLQRRVAPALARILEQTSDQGVLIVGHRHTNSVILCEIMGWPLERSATLRIRQRFLYEITLAGPPEIATIRLEGERTGKRYRRFRS